MAIKSGNRGLPNNTQEAIEQAADMAYTNHEYRLSQNLRALIQIHAKGLDEPCFTDLRLFMTGQLDGAINQIKSASDATPVK